MNVEKYKNTQFKVVDKLHNLIGKRYFPKVSVFEDSIKFSYDKRFFIQLDADGLIRVGSQYIYKEDLKILLKALKFYLKNKKHFDFIYEFEEKYLIGQEIEND